MLTFYVVLCIFYGMIRGVDIYVDNKYDVIFFDYIFILSVPVSLIMKKIIEVLNKRYTK